MKEKKHDLFKTKVERGALPVLCHYQKSKRTASQNFTNVQMFPCPLHVLQVPWKLDDSDQTAIKAFYNMKNLDNEA